jgi:nucleotide-binding universal stress UspA family protein
MYRRILVPIDGSPTARRGLDAAIRLARQTGASLRLFHAIDDPFTALGIDDVVAAPRNIDALLERNARRIVDEGLAAAARAGVAADDEIEYRLHGPLPDLVAEAARGWTADLIVIGTHGRRGVTRMLAGSDAEQILRAAPVPVMMVRGEADE